MGVVGGLSPVFLVGFTFQTSLPWTLVMWLSAERLLSFVFPHPEAKEDVKRSVCENISSCLRVLMAEEPLTELEAAIEIVVTTFFTFASQEGRKGSLSINEFKDLATQQLPHLLKDVGSLDEKMKSLDVNQDSELKFNEYWRLIGELAKEIKKEKALEIRKK